MQEREQKNNPGKLRGTPFFISKPVNFPLGLCNGHFLLSCNLAWAVYYVAWQAVFNATNRKCHLRKPKEKS